jgi:dTDP-4-dehydrorhamnose 3,5-epimerase
MGEGMKVSQTPIDGLMVVATSSRSDHRGSFSRLYCHEELRDVIGQRQIAQINHSQTSNVGAVRGLHYQQGPHAEMKLVRCLKGKVWDVAVDLRHGSPTFLKWHAEELSPDNSNMMVIPEGCAHGFQVLEPGCELLYLHTNFFASSAEGGVRPTDPMLSIGWPLPVKDLSDRDQNLPLLASDFTGLVL